MYSALNHCNGGVADWPLPVDWNKACGVGEFVATWQMLMSVRICVLWSAPSLLATGCICPFSKQPHHRPDFCLNRKHNGVQWKGPGLEHRLNPVWFGDKLRSTERKIKREERNRAELPAIFARLLYDLTATSGQLTQQQQVFVIRADCLSKAHCCSSEGLFIAL